MLRLLPFVLAIFAFAGSAAAESNPCLAGNYLHEGKCVPAPPGYYVAEAGAIAATQCDLGTYQGSFGMASCYLAPPGSYVAEAGAYAATQCSLGRYQPVAGQTSCILAEPGSFVAVSGAVKATLAPIGTYVDTIAASAPIKCEVGLTTLKLGAIHISECVTDPAVDFEGFCYTNIGTLTDVGGFPTCTVVDKPEVVEEEVVKWSGVSDRGWAVYLEQEVTKLTIYTFGLGGSDYTVPSFATEYGPVEVTRCFNPGGREFYNLGHKHCQYTPPTE